MSTDKVTIPGHFLQEVHEHIRKTGQPLLRAHERTDQVTVLASSHDDGTYELTLEEEDVWISSIQTWEEMAFYFGMELPELVEELNKPGYPYGVPEGEDPDEYPSVEVWDVRDLLIDLVPGPTLHSVLARLPERFVWDPTTTYPGVPYSEEDVLEWLDTRGWLSAAAETCERRSGVGENVTWSQSATTLSCLQYVMDLHGCKAWVRLAQ